jgi:hypothetical protein
MINSPARGRKVSDGLDQNNPLLSVTAARGGLVNVFDNDVQFGTMVSDVSEVWNFKMSPLGGDTHSLTVTAMDLSARNVVTPSALDVTADPNTPAPVSNVVIAEGGSAEIDGPGTQSVTFTGITGTLTIDHALAFTGQVFGLAGADALDLADLSYGANTTATFLGDTTGGTLTVTDGSHTANISLSGNYLSSSWTLSSDGNGGTVVVDPVPANAWQTLKIGAGGVLSGIDVAPDGTMVVRTDTYGAYIWNGSQWQQLVTATSMPAAIVTPNSNNVGVYEIQIASSNSNILYMMYLGDVFKSTDKGTTWSLTNFSQVSADPNDSYRSHGQKMAVDPNNPNVVYVGTPQNGLFVTQDGGVTWQNVSAVPIAQTDSSGGNPGITGILFDPALGVTGGKTNTIFASSYGNGVYESTNGGASWTHLSGSPTDVDYAAVSSTGAYYVVGSNSSQLWRYMNGAWTQLLTSYNYGITSVAINPLNPSEIVVVGVNSNPNVSYDGGATWNGFGLTNQASATDIPWLAGTGGTLAYLGSDALVFNPLVPNQLITTGGTGVWNTILPQNWTANTPVVWNSQTAGIEQLCANQIIVPLSGHPVVASWDRGFFYVSDPNSYPTSYGPVANAFVMGWSLDYASSNPNFVVGIANWWGTEQSGYSTDGGQTWNLFPTMPAFAGKTIGGTIAASSPTDIVWAPANGFQPYYTINGGVTWSPVNLPGVTDWSGFDWSYYLNAQTVTADRVLANTFYLYYAGQGVYRTTDGGANWTKVFSGEISSTSYYCSELESVPGQASNLFFTGGPTGDLNEPFMRSTDGGTTWTAVANVNEVSVFGFGAPATPGGYPSIYIAGYVNGVYGIWQSNDNAKSWIQIGDYPTGSLAGIRSISGDPNIYGQVYVGLAGDGFAYLPAAGTTTTTTVVDQAPVVTAINKTLTHNQSVAASTLFSATDPDGQTITTYALKDVTGNGHFVVNGVVQASNVEIDLTAAQLAQTTYQSGSGSDQISIRASDGTLWSTWQTATVTAPVDQTTGIVTAPVDQATAPVTAPVNPATPIVTAPVDQAPVVTASNQTLTHNQSIAASSLFTATDPDGDPITTYALKDVTGNGYFVVNGVVQATNVEIDLTATQLAQATYVAGSGSDQISIRASDGTLWSTWQTVTVTAPLDQATAPVTAPADQATPPETAPVDPANPAVTVPVDQAPVVTVSDKTLMRNQDIIAVSSLFTTTDPEGDPITTYALKDLAGDGHFVVNGVVQTSNEIDLTAAQLAQTAYQSGSGCAQISISASDGTLWSEWQTTTLLTPVGSQNAAAAIALLAQYTAAGFQTGTDSGALVSSGQPCLNTNNPTLISLPSQKI